MSIPDRIVKLSKSYLGQVRERIDDALSERELALRELETGAGSPPVSTSSSGSDPDSLMRRAEEKIAAARREMEAGRELRPAASAPTLTAPTPAASATLDPDAAHYKILGVAPGSDYATVQAAFEKLTARLDANRFENETDKAEARKILERVNSAYDSLRSKLDPTQNRFGKLEL